MVKEHTLRIGKNETGVGSFRHVMYAGMLNDKKEFSLAVSHGNGMYNLCYPVSKMEVEVNGRRYRVVKVTEEEITLRE